MHQRLGRRRRRHGCIPVAWSRARARVRRKAGFSRWFLFAFAFIDAALFPPGPLVAERSRRPDTDHFRNDHKLQVNSVPQERERYRVRPTMVRLMKDLRRSAAAEDASREILARVPDDVTRWWVAEKISRGDLIDLAIHVSPRDDLTLEAWRRAIERESLRQGADSDLDGAVKALLELVGRGSGSGDAGFRRFDP